MNPLSVYIICDLGYGDAGKGTITDYLCRTRDIGWNIRYTGGPQASHFVVLPDGRFHCFSQFGSGMLSPGVKTLISQEMLIAMPNLQNEDIYLIGRHEIYDAMNRMFIAEEAIVIMPFQKMIGQIREICRGRKRFGSCGQGVGEARLDADKEAPLVLRLRDLADLTLTTEILRRCQQDKNAEVQRLRAGHPEQAEAIAALMKHYAQTHAPSNEAKSLCGMYKMRSFTAAPQAALLKKIWAQNHGLLFEGAQGALLDPLCGFPPYVTKTRATDHHAAALIAAATQKQRTRTAITKIGLLRAYAHRHGAGPLPTENDLADRLQDKFNQTNPWQGTFRFGWLDLVAIKYGLTVNHGVDRLAITCLDQLTGLSQISICLSYEYRGNMDALRRSDNFTWKKIRGGQTAEVSAINAGDVPHTNADTEILQQCRPYRCLDLPGWSQDITTARSPNDLPKQARRYIGRVEAELGKPISIVSVNPTYEGKLELA